MRIWLDPNKLISYGLTTTDVVNAIEAQNAEVSAGQIGGSPAAPGQQLNATIIAQSRLQTPEEFGRILVRVNTDGSQVRLSDVARIDVGAENYNTIARYNGKPAAGLGISLATGANALDTAEAVRARIAELKPFFPAGMEVAYPYDTTPFVKLSIEGVMHTLLEAIVLVFVVMYLFLQNFRATLIPTIAVPVVLLGTFGILSVAGLHDQHADDVRHGAGDRPAGRRRHRRGRERRARDGGGRPVAEGGDAQEHGPDHRRPDRHRPGAVRRVRADGLLRRIDRRHLPAVLADDRVRDGAVGDRGADPDAGALRHHAEAAESAAKGAPGHGQAMGTSPSAASSAGSTAPSTGATSATSAASAT